MKKDRKIFTLLTLTVLCALVLGLFPVSGEEKLYDSVVRLHVLANSDSDVDQALKLKVRDRIIEVTEDIFTQARSKDEAETVARLALSMIEDEAKRVVEESGFDYPVTVTLGQEEYPERDYEGLKFPAGEYLSLRVLIGDAEGQNWWCVLFPPICLRAASRDQRDTEEAFIAAGLTGEQYRIITESGSGRYKIKFKILEVIKELFG